MRGFEDLRHRIFSLATLKGGQLHLAKPLPLLSIVYNAFIPT